MDSDSWLYSGEVFGLEHVEFRAVYIDILTTVFCVNKVMVYLYEDFKEEMLNFLTQMNKDLGCSN